MILWNGGLPGSGKSYDAVTRHLVRAIAKGRPVDAYVDGLDFERIADAAAVPRARVDELLRVLTVDDLADPWERTRTNALVIVDEAQSIWPNRGRVNASQDRFATQHRHRGQDILLMGQDYRDVHVLFRRRIELRFEFLKLSAVGKENRYSITTFRHRGGEDEPVLVGTQQEAYNPELFGLYKSHVSEEVQTENYSEGRGSIWSVPIIRYGVPFSLVFGILGLWWVVKFFRGDAIHAPPPPAVMASASAPAARLGPSPAPAAAPALPASAAAQSDPVAVAFKDLDSLGRIRLAGVLRRGQAVQGVVEWVGSDARVVHRLTFDDLRELGVGLSVSSASVILNRGDWTRVAFQWPTESDSRVSESRSERIRAASGAASAPDGAPAVPPSLGSLGGTKPAPAAAPQSEPPGDVEVRRAPPRRA